MEYMKEKYDINFPFRKNNEFYTPDLLRRETEEDGFSKGYGFHFPPCEQFWTDCHNHLSGWKTHADIYRLLDEWFAELDAYRLGKVLAIAKPEDDFQVLSDVSKQDRRFGWLVYITADKPDVKILENAIKNNCIGLKLHNNIIMKGLVKPDVWYDDEWDRIFSLAQEAGLPLLWHVTQRITDSPYHGGSYNAYFGEGRERGVKFGNQMLLDISLDILKKYPGIKLLGAHQLYMGIQNLARLFDEYENLYIDTSCGFYLRWADRMFDEERHIYRDFIRTYEDRILFGTDSALNFGGVDEYLVQSFLCHARFINHLRLPDQTLQKVAHENAEKLFGVGPVEYARRGNVRP